MTKITTKEYNVANTEMEKMLQLATSKGGFEKLTKKETETLMYHTNIVEKWETENVIIPQPQTLQGIIELKMYENKLKQKELAKLLHTSTTQLNEILHNKRKPSITFLKYVNQFLGVDGNLLLRLV
jgi:HTH-type transcriptional regulator / antitoxin HigA